MKFTLVTLSLCLAFSAPVFAVQASNAAWLPQVYGSTQGQVIRTKGIDLEAELLLATLGFKGMYRGDGYRVIYDTSFQYSGNYQGSNGNDKDEIELREGKVVIATDSYGGISLGKGVSGAWNDLYRLVDIHYANTMETVSENHLFVQKKKGNTSLGYSSPRWDMLAGQMYFKAALSNSNNSNSTTNGTDFDTIGLRMFYIASDFNLIVNRAEGNRKFAGTYSDLIRWTVAADYKFNDFTVAALAEINEGSLNRAGIDSVYGASVKYQINDKLTFGLSHQWRQYEKVKALDDVHLTIASIKYDVDRYLSLYAEAANYNTEFADKNDNVSAGFIFKF
ncbi:MAG: porin [Ferrimonas sp.]